MVTFGPCLLVGAPVRPNMLNMPKSTFGPTYAAAALWHLCFLPCWRWKMQLWYWRRDLSGWHTHQNTMVIQAISGREEKRSG